jgi:molecular chaperone HtpG
MGVEEMGIRLRMRTAKAFKPLPLSRPDVYPRHCFCGTCQAGTGLQCHSMFLFPVRLEKALETNPKLHGAVKGTIVRSAAIATEKRPFFFPEYTDHSFTHFEDVLRAADALIPDTSHFGQGPFTACDAAILSLSVVLHDLGMHLSFDGFSALIGGRHHQQPKCAQLSYFDEPAWPELWDEFFSEARRWDSRKMTAIFGKPVVIRRPPKNELDLALEDRMLIGEFLRRNHPRLAHGIALFGFPGAVGTIPLLDNELGLDLLDLTGLVARSHGGPLRNSIEPLTKHFHQRVYKDIHAVYLMVLLRIADYLQVQAERAPGGQLAIQSLNSPVSLREWYLHQAISNLSLEEDDPEAAYVDARPPDVKGFLRLKELLIGLQSELDTSWAVLGEVYVDILSFVASGFNCAEYAQIWTMPRSLHAE